VVIGLLCSAVFVALSLRRIDLAELWTALRSSAWWPWYLLAPGLYMVGHFVRGVRSRMMLEPHCHIDNWTSMNIVTVGYAANNILPARLGELVRAYVLRRRTGVSVTLAVAILLVERIFDGLVITLMLFAAALYAPLPEWGQELLWVALGLFASAAGVVVAVMLTRDRVLAVADSLARRAGTRLGPRLRSLAHRIVSATDCVRSPRLLLGIILLSISVWFVEGCMFLAVLPAFGLPAQPLWALLALSITNLGILMPSSPGYIGPFHFFCMQALMVFSVPREVALGYAIMVHLLYFIPVTIWGVVAMMVLGVKPAQAIESVAAELPVAGWESKVNVAGG
jgi:uncharacterized protein (TIRG00374 family)